MTTNIFLRLIASLKRLSAIITYKSKWHNYRLLSKLHVLYHKLRSIPILVYNIQVENEPEFYANGLLVHNCPLCMDLEGVVLDLKKEARGIIPRHPNCRCAFRPANIGEDRSKQIRSKLEIDKAFDSTLRREITKGRTIKGLEGRRFKDPLTGRFTVRRKKRTLAQRRKLSPWSGARTKIAVKRPKSIFDRLGDGLSSKIKPKP